MTCYAYIGCGLTGTTLFWQHIKALAEQSLAQPPLTQQHRVSPDKVKIYIIEKSGHFGPGLPYGQAVQDCHLVNMEACSASISPEDDMDFVNWMQENADHLKQQYGDIDLSYRSFPPRKVVGEYLSERFADALKSANHMGIKVDLICHEVVDLIWSGKHASIIFNDSPPINADQVVLTTGHWQSAAYPECLTLGKDLQRRGVGGYFHPWPSDKLQTAIPEDGKVAVMGASTSAIDVAYTLFDTQRTDRDTQRQVYFHSRTGRLPKVKSIRHPTEHKAPILSKQDIAVLTNNGGKMACYQQMVELFNQRMTLLFKQASDADKPEMDNCDFSPKNFFSSATNWMTEAAQHTLEQDLDYATQTPNWWNDLHFSLRDSYSALARLYPHFSDKDKRRFDREFYRPFTTHVAAIPRDSALRLKRLLGSGQINVVGGLSQVEADFENQQFVLHSQLPNGAIRTDHYTYLVDATGQNRDCATASRLYKNLLKRELISPHPAGGIQVEYDSSEVITGNGIKTGFLYAIGAMTLGERIGSSAIVASAKFASRLVCHFMQKDNIQTHY